MANYYETARTNYFTVKDEAAFRAWAQKWRLEVAEGSDSKTFAVFPPRYNEGGFDLYDEEEDDTLDIADEIAAHLTDDSVAVVMGAGAEKFRYVCGWAVAINSKGERIQLNLDQIYDMALEKFGVKPSQALY